MRANQRARLLSLLDDEHLELVLRVVGGQRHSPSTVTIAKWGTGRA
jgi:hypothetical protein